MITTSTPSFRSVARGVDEPCGPTATIVSAMPASAARVNCGDPQFRRRAAPEQIARRGRDDEHVGSEAGYPTSQFRQVQPLGVRVENSRLVPRLAEQRPGIAVFERQMRLAATEIDAALE